MTPSDSPPKRRGCFFYGCLALLLVAVLGGLGLYFVTRFAMDKASQWVNTFTEPAPALLERAGLPPAELTALQTRVSAFGDALKQPTNATLLILTAREINALIESDPNFKALKDKVSVSIDGEHLKGNISVPLPDFGPFKFKGRYLNGLASFKVALAGGQLSVTLDDVQVKGAPLPAAFLAQLKQQNLAKDAQNDPRNREVLGQFDSIQITNGTVVLRSQPKK